MLSLAAVLAFSCVGCRDGLLNADPARQSRNARLFENYVCSVNVVARQTTCRRDAKSPGATGAPSDTSIGPAIELRFSKEHYTASDSLYGANVRVVNRTEDALGTRDGTTVTGVTVFFESGPVVTAYRGLGDSTDHRAGRVHFPHGDSGVVRVRNPDGHGTFTKAQQPFFLYPEIVPAGEQSEPREWQWVVPSRVRSFDFMVRVFTGVRGEIEVPAEIPSNWSVPRRYYDPQSQGYCGFGGAGPCVYDAVSVLFRRDATQQERQAAVDVVNGTVEGGSRSTGRYYIRLPADTTFRLMQSSLGQLRALPQVEWAVPYDLSGVSLNYLRPTDGSGWQSWQVKDSLTGKSRRTWGLEAISAPLAWGCETGTIAGKIGIVDTDFHDPADLVGRLVDSSDKGVPLGGLNLSQDSVDHGTRVASIIAATGNDSSEMTGVLWRSTVRTYEFALWDSANAQPYRSPSGSVVLDPQMAMDELMKAGKDGVSVINFSLGTDWNQQGALFGYISPGQTYDPAKETNAARITRNDSLRAERWKLIREAIREIKSSGNNPLIVMSAGNNGTSSAWDGFKTAADSFPGNVLVVAAAEDAGSGRLRPMGSTVSGMSFGTNHGSQVQISAPGEDVWMLDRNGQVRRSGTSFAAPYVTGVAGLLLSFDPRLEQQADVLKQLILDGARNGRRRVANGSGADSIPVLDAHEALKAAGQRPGAPLCGNRVWVESGAVHTRRAAADGDQVEALTPGGMNGADLHVLHGGKRLFLWDGNANRSRHFRWSPPSGWAEAVLTADTANAWYAEEGPTYRSGVGFSHDRDSVTYLSAGSTGTEVVVRQRGTQNIRVLGVLPNGGASYHDTATVCIRKSTPTWSYPEGSCYEKIRIGLNENTGTKRGPFYSPRGDRVLVVTGGTFNNVTLQGDWFDCSWTEAGTQFSQLCHNYRTVWGDLPHAVHAFPTRSGASPTIIASSTMAFGDIAVGDGAEEFTVRERSTARSRSVRWVPGNATNSTHWQMRMSDASGERCDTQFRSLASGAVLQTRSGCGLDVTSFAPYRSPGGVGVGSPGAQGTTAGLRPGNTERAGGRRTPESARTKQGRRQTE
jgi:hypothetical protein